MALAANRVGCGYGCGLISWHLTRIVLCGTYWHVAILARPRVCFVSHRTGLTAIIRTQIIVVVALASRLITDTLAVGSTCHSALSLVPHIDTFLHHRGTRTLIRRRRSGQKLSRRLAKGWDPRKSAGMWYARWPKAGQRLGSAEKRRDVVGRRLGPKAGSLWSPSGVWQKVGRRLVGG